MNWEQLCQDFRNPGVQVRPLQIVHGLDGYLREDGATGEGETAPEQVAAGTGERGWPGLDRLFARLKEGGAGGVVTNVSWGPGYLRNPEGWESTL